MPHRKIRRLRKGIEQKKSRASEAAERRREKLRSVAKKAGASKRRAERRVARVTVPIEHEARETARETRLLAREVKEPVARAASAGQSAAERTRSRLQDVGEAGRGIREKAAEFDEKLSEIQQIEADTLGMAGQDFGTDLEIVDDIERGEKMEGMGDVGMGTTFDEFDAPLSERLTGADEATFDGDIFDETEDGLDPDLNAIDEDIIGNMEGSS